jgi:hypothetical protein
LNNLPRDQATKKLLYWDLDRLPTSVGIEWHKESEVMMITVKAWLTKIEALTFTLDTDPFKGHLLWCLDWCPLPEYIVINNATLKPVIPIEYYFNVSEMFEDLNISYPVINPATSEPFWDSTDADIMVVRFSEFVSRPNLTIEKYPYFFSISLPALTFEKYFSGEIESKKFTFAPFPPYWTSPDQVAFVNMSSLAKYIDTLRATNSNNFDDLYFSPGIIARYVLYQKSNYYPLFDPLDVPTEYWVNYTSARGPP